MDLTLLASQSTIRNASMLGGTVLCDDVVATSMLHWLYMQETPDTGRSRCVLNLWPLCVRDSQEEHYYCCLPY